MGDLVSNYRFVVKPVIKETGRSLDLARPMKIHPLTYQELPFNPEYTNYADGRFTLEKLSHATADEMYWKARQEIILRHTGEHPYEISGPDAENLLQQIFPRDISKVKIGRCSYQFACYHDGGIISDGLLLRLEKFIALCYLNDNFHDNDNLPIVNTTIENIEESLESLILNHEKRKEISLASQNFIKEKLNNSKVFQELEKIYTGK